MPRSQSVSAVLVAGMGLFGWRERFVVSTVRVAHVLLSIAFLVTTVSMPSVAQSAATWNPVGSLASAHWWHTATLLPNGKVLVAGGENNSGVIASVELYDPASGTWSAGRSLAVAREEHTATLLPNGKVLVVGGSDGNRHALSSVELYDPGTNTWAFAAPLATARGGHTATLLNNGKVLVAGGIERPAGAELYDPATNSWSSAGTISPSRYSHSAVLLADGRAMLIGGWDGSDVTRSVLIYDPGTNNWTSAAPLQTARAVDSVVRLPDGRVLVPGGAGNASGYIMPLADVEIYDPVANHWSGAAQLNSARFGHSVTVLPNGNVLVAGGWQSCGDICQSNLASAEVYDPGANLWLTVSSLNTARQWHTATPLGNGQVLVAGGLFAAPLASAEVYGAPSNGLVARYYQVILGRTATSDEVISWDGAVDRVGGLGVAAKEGYRVLPGIFFHSPEYVGRGTSDSQYVTDLYQALFNRSPDSGGFTYWTGQLGLGLPRDEALFGFLFAAESNSYYASVLGSGSTRAEVNMVMDFYRGMMNRLPDSGGFAYWTWLIRTAQCQGSAQVTSMVNSISSQFLQSGEYVGRARSNADFVSDMYYTFMRRGATLNEVNYWTGQLNSAALTRDGVRTQFLNSSEFQTRVSGVIAQGCSP